MKEENPYGCRTLSRKGSFVQSKTTLSSFINITFPQPKIRIRMPKLLAKTLRRRNPQKCDDTENANDVKKKKKNNGWTEPGSSFPKKVSSIVSNVFGNKKSAEKSSEETEETGETEESRKEAKAPSGFGGIFNKRNGKQASSSRLIRVSNRKIRRGKSVREKEITDRAEKNGDENEKEEEGRGEEELCKKRILMGEKCRPLNQSGVLHYDENGVILPEVDFLCENVV
ncbi:hypothetical protein Vadar_019053 [Vaccinium darrowii]|uniref:Uncharacterized protein n=1 Tax=Vaccinium darrowii TaxID=229202 RepID=A0ACB7ZLF6_9ERIC|nr:hypothetical protein Vadar_019053 [Vaccinium darrowii]